jgi:hypothetical protein
MFYTTQFFFHFLLFIFCFFIPFHHLIDFLIDFYISLGKFIIRGKISKIRRKLLALDIYL